MRQHVTPDERVKRVQEIVDGAGADVVLEVSGVPAAFVEGVQLARPAARLSRSAT